MRRKREAAEQQEGPEEDATGAAPGEMDTAPAEVSDGAAAASADAQGAPEGPDGGPERLSALEAELAEMRDRYLRAVADMENVRRRARQDAEESRKFANERLLSELLPVLDNFTRALEAAEQNSSYEALKSGVDQIHRQLDDVLTRAGLERIEALGQPFDPNVHEAIMQVEPQEGQDRNRVVEELRPGYKLNERVVRPTLVKVTSA